MGFLEHLRALMPDEVLVTPGSMDAYGAFVPSGAAAAYSCRIEGSRVMTRGADGREVLSTVQVILGESPGLTAHLHAYTLPARYSPRELLVALSVESESDENGPCYEAVMLP